MRWRTKKFLSLMGCQNHFSLMSLLTLDVSPSTHTHTHPCVRAQPFVFLSHLVGALKASLVGQWAQAERDGEGEQGENGHKCSNSTETEKNYGGFLVTLSFISARATKGIIRHWSKCTYTLFYFAYQELDEEINTTASPCQSLSAS